MNPADERSGIARLAHGDADVARDLRANLAIFARQTDTPHIRALVSDVLAGRRNIYEVLNTKEFTEVATHRLKNLEAGIEQLTDEQRQEAFNPDRPATPAARLEALRDTNGRHTSEIDSANADPLDPTDPDDIPYRSDGPIFRQP